MKNAIALLMIAGLAAPAFADNHEAPKMEKAAKKAVKGAPAATGDHHGEEHGDEHKKEEKKSH